MALPPTQINGFEVQDTEEALMMFLEQDPVITVTVARTRGVSKSASHYNVCDVHGICIPVCEGVLLET